ncbi:MAG: substrate-binding domain-containing protein, partial [Anaerolineae bacterium]|nr:substrate-binding domain-containing protein [Anaerolineae bacterium]
AIEYLIRRGHRHIGLIGGGPEAYPSLRDRYNGYRRALKDNNIQESYLARSVLKSGPAYKATLALLKGNPHITALFGCNDEVAIAAMQAIRDLGMKVPEDISIIGYDDIDLAQHVIPSLTTMQVDKVSMGQIAVQMLTWRLANPDSQRVTVVIHTPLIERKSVRYVRNHSYIAQRNS